MEELGLDEAQMKRHECLCPPSSRTWAQVTEQQGSALTHPYRHIVAGEPSSCGRSLSNPLAAHSFHAGSCWYHLGQC